ncbi:MAG: hypothetical protein QW292_06320 [Candidatus Parvarchaeota archaeon]
MEDFLERTATSIGTSAFTYIPRKFVERRVYAITTRNEGTLRGRGKG